jgi:hypothetical protein
MAEKKRMDEEALKEEEEQRKKDIEATKDDVCPHCLQHVHDMPYISAFPLFGWVECAACGVVFAPRSIRKRKQERASSGITTPKLLVPASVRQ